MEQQDRDIAFLGFLWRHFGQDFRYQRASLIAQLVKKSACDAGDPSSISGSGRSPGEGKVYPLQYSGLGQRSLAGHSLVCRVAKSLAWLSN